MYNSLPISGSPCCVFSGHTLHNKKSWMSVLAVCRTAYINQLLVEDVSPSVCTPVNENWDDEAITTAVRSWSNLTLSYFITQHHYHDLNHLLIRLTSKLVPYQPIKLPCFGAEIMEQALNSFVLNSSLSNWRKS